MKLYADYMLEREGISCKYTDTCFITYKKLDNESIFVYDMFSNKEQRGEGAMVAFCQEFCMEQKLDGIKVIYGTTVETTNGWENSDRLLRKFGFRYSGKDEDDKTVNNYFLELGE